MILARMDDGRVVVHNAIALDDAEMSELEAWGNLQCPRRTERLPPAGHQDLEAALSEAAVVGARGREEAR